MMENTKCYCLKVPLHQVKYALSSFENFLRDDLKFSKENGFIFLPLKSVPADLKGFELIERSFNKRNRKVSYREIADVPDEVRKNLPRSFDVVGDIGILKLEESLLKFKKEIGEAMLKANNALRVVCIDRGIKKDFRLRDLEVIAGENRTVTTHREYGVDLRLDLKEVFFSPRLAQEHWLSTRFVKENSTVLDMFAGCGPFSILIGKQCKPAKIYAVDINPKAIKWLKENILKNKLEEVVEPIQGDVGRISKRLREKGIRMDNIVMNLPFGARSFFKDALSLCRNGGLILYYEILDKKASTKRMEDLKREGLELGKKIEVLSRREVKSYSAKEINISLIVKVRD
jgi:tRNA (guanine37-N1)-methyltransferase